MPQKKEKSKGGSNANKTKNQPQTPSKPEPEAPEPIVEPTVPPQPQTQDSLIQFEVEASTPQQPSATPDNVQLNSSEVSDETSTPSVSTPSDTTVTASPTPPPHALQHQVIPPINTELPTKTTSTETQPNEIPLPESAMPVGPEDTPELHATHVDFSGNSSCSPSRTATPATGGYETANYETPTTPSPRTARLPTPAAVRRSVTIDWPLDLAISKLNGQLEPFSQSFQAPSLSNSPTTITCASEYDIHSNPGIRITLDLGYAANVDLRILNQADASLPILNYFKDACNKPEFRIPWRSLKTITPSKLQPFLLLSITISTSPDPPHPASQSAPQPSISETCSPASIEALAFFLDQPGGHDVVFCFPDHKHLYADRYVLQRASRYFRALFQSRNREGIALQAAPNRPLHALADDSDAEPPTYRANGGEAARSPKTNGTGRNGSASSSRSRSSPTGSLSERDITTTVLTPMTSVNGDMDHLSPDNAKYTFQRTASPLMDDNIFVMNINETSFNTFRAFLYYLYTGFISFSPLTSSFQFIDDPSFGDPETLEQRRLEARNQLVGEYMRKYPNRPVPVSPKSIYAVAKKYEHPALEAQSLARINSAIVNPLVATSELFSAFTRANDSIKETQLEKVIDNWEDVVRSPDWVVARQKGTSQPDSYFASVLCEILEKLPSRQPLVR